MAICAGAVRHLAAYSMKPFCSAALQPATTLWTHFIQRVTSLFKSQLNFLTSYRC